MNVGTDEKVSQNQNLAKKLSIMLHEKCGWLKQMREANEKHNSNK